MSSQDVQVILTKKFNPSHVKLGPVNKNYIPVFYPKKGDDSFVKLFIQTPKMSVPWEMKEKKSRQGKIFAYTLTASTGPVGSEKNQRNIDMFRDKIVQLETKIKELLPVDFKNKTFYSSLWQSDNSNFKPTMRLTIPCYNGGEPKVSVFDKNKEPTEVDKIVPKSVCTFIIVLDSIWSTADKVGINWNIDEVVIYEQASPVTKTKFMFKEEESSSDED